MASFNNFDVRTCFSIVFFVVLAMISGGLGAVSMSELKDFKEAPNPGTDVYWGLTDANKTKTCIMLSGFFELVIPYNTDYGTESIAIIPIPKNASVNGVCDNPANTSVEILRLSWTPSSLEEKRHNVTFIFVRIDEGGSFGEPYYELGTIFANVSTNEEEFPSALEEDQVYKLKASNLGIMSAPEKLSYFCKSTLVVEFDDGKNVLGMSQVHAEAFHTQIAMGDAHDFGPKSFCSKDGFEVILKVLTYIIILALIGLGIFYILDRRRRSSYVYM